MLDVSRVSAPVCPHLNLNWQSWHKPCIACNRVERLTEVHCDLKRREALKPLASDVDGRMWRGMARSIRVSIHLKRLRIQRGQSVEIVTGIDESSRELLQRVDSAIKGNPHLSRHQVFCQEESGIVILHGRVGSFFQKQMAQEALKRLAGVEKVINELQVDWLASVSPK